MRNKRDLKKPHDDAELAGLAWTSQSTEGEDVGHYKSGTARFTEFSKLSAKMVELSLQEAQRNLTPRTGVKDKLPSLSSPLPDLLTDASRVVEPPIEDAGRRRTGVPEAAAPARFVNIQQARQMPRGLSIPHFGVLYAQAKVIRRKIISYWSGPDASRKHVGYIILGVRRTAFLIGHWTRMLTARAPAIHFAVRGRFALAQRYRCPDCGREVGVRSRPRNFMECYVLPLLIIQPVRCAACFHRDYRLIFTRVSHRSRHYDSSIGKSTRDAA